MGTHGSCHPLHCALRITANLCTRIGKIAGPTLSERVFLAKPHSTPIVSNMVWPAWMRWLFLLEVLPMCLVNKTGEIKTRVHLSSLRLTVSKGGFTSWRQYATCTSIQGSRCPLGESWP